VLHVPSVLRNTQHEVAKTLNHQKNLIVALVLATILTGCQGLFGRVQLGQQVEDALHELLTALERKVVLPEMLDWLAVQWLRGPPVFHLGRETDCRGGIGDDSAAGRGSIKTGVNGLVDRASHPGPRRRSGPQQPADEGLLSLLIANLPTSSRPISPPSRSGRYRRTAGQPAGLRIVA